MKSLTLFFLISISLIFLNSCTGNDLFDDEVKVEKKTISGTVKLEDQTDHSGIYVWFPLTDQGVFTNSQGEFSYSIPANLKRQGIEYFKFFFFINDYALVQDTVLMTDGKLNYGDNTLNDQGNLKRIYLLKRLFTVSEYFSPDLPDFPDIKLYKWIKVTLKDQGSLGIPVSHVYPPSRDPIFETSSFVALQNNTVIFRNYVSVELRRLQSSQSDVSDEFLFLFNMSTLADVSSSGDSYTIIPVIYGNDKATPSELLNNLKVNIGSPDNFENIKGNSLELSVIID